MNVVTLVSHLKFLPIDSHLPGNSQKSKQSCNNKFLTTQNSTCAMFFKRVVAWIARLQSCLCSTYITKDFTKWGGWVGFARDSGGDRWNAGPTVPGVVERALPSEGLVAAMVGCLVSKWLRTHREPLMSSTRLEPCPPKALQVLKSFLKSFVQIVRSIIGRSDRDVNCQLNRWTSPELF